MSISPDEQHGKESARICRDFFNESKIIPPVNFPEICQAIENHDDKGYMTIDPEKPDHSLVPIHTLLNISDDLDAFGYTGIYRYAEIYLLRNIHPDQLAEKVAVYLKKRFEYIISSIGHLTYGLHRLSQE